MAFTAGQIFHYDYTGSVVSLSIPAGEYASLVLKLEVWGAQGGYRSDETKGGKGGYSVGVLTLGEAGATLYIRVGGAGNMGGTDGGFNGGGARDTYSGGGGASDIRIGQDSLYARVIVAGGGGSDGAANKTGMYGGGESGGTSSENYGSGGGGGTQTAGGAGGSGNDGAFGQGGEGRNRSSGYGGAGGGGWYGGGGAYPDGSGDDDRGGGGGSGYVYTPATAGNTSFTTPRGSAETGHSGNGYVRITVVSAEETVKIKPPGNFRQTSQEYFEIGLAWDGSEGASGYNLYKDGTLIYTGTDLSYLDTQVYPKTSYVYQVAAFSAEGESDPATLEASTKAGWAVIEPIFLSASIGPNPANINQSILISVQLTDAVRILEAETFYSGELYAGEV